MVNQMVTLKKRLWNNIRHRLLAGILLFLPFGVTLLVMRWLFSWLEGTIRPIAKGCLSGIDRIALFDPIPEIYVNIAVLAVSILIVLFVLYLVGSFGQVLIGRRIIGIGENLLLQIPLVRTIYSATKQVIQGFSQDQAAFKSVVMLEFPRPGFLALGFLTGHMRNSQGKKYCKVFIPTAPNPTSGYFQIVPAEEVRETGITVEEAFKILISGGVISSGIFDSFRPIEEQVS
jgi:uncharacterized membrane protein